MLLFHEIVYWNYLFLSFFYCLFLISFVSITILLFAYLILIVFSKINCVLFIVGITFGLSVDRLMGSVCNRYGSSRNIVFCSLISAAIFSPVVWWIFHLLAFTVYDELMLSLSGYRRLLIIIIFTVTYAWVWIVFLIILQFWPFWISMQNICFILSFDVKALIFSSS